MSEFKAGTAKVNINPPTGTTMCGYAGRPSGNTGLHDDLFARALVLDDGTARVAIVSCDLVGFGADSVARIRKEASARTGIPEKHIMIACSHTHSGPATMMIRACGNQDEKVTTWIEGNVVDSIAQAAAGLKPAKLSRAYGTSDIGVNRRQTSGGGVCLGVNPGGVRDPEVCVLAVDSTDGKPIAVLVNHGCHAVVMGGDNLLTSADFPGAMAKALEESRGGMAAFLQGCCGDINPRERASFEVVEKLGRKLANDAIETLKKPRAVSGKLQTASEIVDLPIAPLASREEAQTVLAASLATIESAKGVGVPLGQVHVAEGYRDWAKNVLALHDSGNLPTSIRAEIQAIRVGDLVLVSLPGEIFSEIGLQIKNAIPGAFVLGYTNGNVGYVFTEAAYSQGGYEVDCASRLYGEPKFSPKAERTMVDAAVRIAKSVG